MKEGQQNQQGQSNGNPVPLADLEAQPGGARDRQVMLGEPLVVVEWRGGHAFVQMGKDGYCGWLPDAVLEPLYRRVVTDGASEAVNAQGMPT